MQLQKKEREDLGVELYGAQQELARYQMILETKHDTYVQKNQQRENQEQELADIRSLYKNLQSTVAVEKKKGIINFIYDNSHLPRREKCIIIQF